MTVVYAAYLGDYRINVYFSDGSGRVIDLAHAFSRLPGYYAQYRQPDLSKSFTIDGSNLVWGED